MKLALLVSTLVFVVSCAHNVQQSLTKIEPGMTRSDVVDKLGSPLYVDRNLDGHVWVYRYYDEELKAWQKRAVFWKNDVVSSLGPAPERQVVLKNEIPKSKKDLAEEEMGNNRGALKAAPSIGSENWYQEIKVLEERQIKKEKQKAVPSYQDIN